jgi:hypothetical protein
MKFDGKIGEIKLGVAVTTARLEVIERSVNGLTLLLSAIYRRSRFAKLDVLPRLKLGGFTLLRVCINRQDLSTQPRGNLSQWANSTLLHPH